MSCCAAPPFGVAGAIRDSPRRLGPARCAAPGRGRPTRLRRRPPAPLAPTLRAALARGGARRAGLGCPVRVAAAGSVSSPRRWCCRAPRSAVRRGVAADAPRGHPRCLRGRLGLGGGVDESRLLAFLRFFLSSSDFFSVSSSSSTASIATVASTEASIQRCRLLSALARPLLSSGLAGGARLVALFAAVLGHAAVASLPQLGWRGIIAAHCLLPAP